MTGVSIENGFGYVDIKKKGHRHFILKCIYYNVPCHKTSNTNQKYEEDLLYASVSVLEFLNS